MPPVAPQYADHFFHFEDRRSLSERFSNAIGYENRPIGRSHALLVGVSRYPAMHETLMPADADVKLLERWLNRSGHFDEIVTLTNQHVTNANLNYFLREYFPTRLEKFPRSRFLFAFSGHGITKGDRSYLLKSDWKSFQDTVNAIGIAELKAKLKTTIDRAHQSLILINSCYGGAFLTQTPFGEIDYLPTGPGAHAITAGRANERVYADSNLGKGSVFFEILLGGLNGRADTLPSVTPGINGDGLITINELATYLKHEITKRSRHKVNPLFADLIPLGSRGGFFFLTKEANPDRMISRPRRSRNVSFGQGDRFTSSGPYTAIDSESKLEWTLLSEGAPANWETANEWCRQSKARLPSTEELMTLTTKHPNKEQPIFQLLNLMAPPRQQFEFWANSKKGFSREVLKTVNHPPKLDTKNPADKCGVLAIIIH